VSKIKASGLRGLISERESASKLGQMDLFTKVNGIKIKLMGMDSSSTLIETFMKETGFKINGRAMEYFCMLMEVSMKVNGLTTRKTD